MRRRFGKTAKTKRIQKKHCKARFVERTGVGISDEEYDAIVKRIQRGEYPLVEKQSNRVTLWRVPIGDKDYTVVYDSHRKSLVTVLYG